MPFPLLTIILLFFFSFWFFSRIYRLAMTWFIRGRTDRTWDARAELATVLASLPLSVVYGSLSIELSLFLARLAVSTGILPQLTDYVDFLTAGRVWLVSLAMLLYMARTVPQTIASSKIYAFNALEHLQNEARRR